MQISSYRCMRKIAKYRTCARVARSIAENASSFLSANRKSPKVGKNSCLWSYGSNIKVAVDFCWLFCPLKLDLESKVPIPSAPRSFFTRIPNFCHRYPECYFPDRACLAQIWAKPSSLALHEKLDLHKFVQCKYGAKKCKRGGNRRQRWEIRHWHTSLHGVVNSLANAVFTISGLGLTLLRTFFAPYLHWINVVKIKFSCSGGVAV